MEASRASRSAMNALNIADDIKPELIERINEMIGNNYQSMEVKFMISIIAYKQPISLKLVACKRCTKGVKTPFEFS